MYASLMVVTYATNAQWLRRDERGVQVCIAKRRHLNLSRAVGPQYIAILRVKNNWGDTAQW